MKAVRIHTFGGPEVMQVEEVWRGLESARDLAGEDLCVARRGKRVARLNSWRQYSQHGEMIRGLLLNHLRIYYLPVG